MLRRSVLTRIGGVAIATTGGVPGVVGARPKGNRGPPADVVVPNDYSTIGAAVAAADEGDTVVVDGGTYREQVFIDKDLTLRGQNGATIEAVDDFQTLNLVESGSTWAPMVLAYGGSESGGEISGTELVDVDIAGFTLDGRGDTVQTGGKTGILYRNVGRTGPTGVISNEVVNMGTPGETFGIVAYGDSTVRIEDNRVIGFGRGGIGANGDGTEHPPPTVDIRGNHIDAKSEPDGAAPNGVQVGDGAAGQVRENTIKNCRYATSLDSLWQSSGILVFESDGVRVHRNALVNNDVAIAASAWGWFLDSADGNSIVKNAIDGALLGVHLRASAWGGFTAADPSVSNNRVVNNDLTDPDGSPAGEIGIAIDSNDYDDSDEFVPTTANNKVIRNSVTGFTEQVSNDGTATKIHAIAP